MRLILLCLAICFWAEASAALLIENDRNAPWLEYADAPYKSSAYAWRSQALNPGQPSSFSITVNGMRNFIFYWKASTDGREGDSVCKVKFFVDGELRHDEDLYSLEWSVVPIKFADDTSHVLTWTAEYIGGGEDEVFAEIWSEMFNVPESQWMPDPENEVDGIVPYRSNAISAGNTTTFSVTVNGNDGAFWIPCKYMMNACSWSELKMYVDGEEVNECDANGEWCEEYLYFDDTSLHIVSWIYRQGAEQWWDASTPNCAYVAIGDDVDLFQIVDYSCSSQSSLPFALDLENCGRRVMSGILGDNGGVLYETKASVPWSADESAGVAGTSMRSCTGGNIDVTTWMSATVAGAGVFSFQWRIPYGNCVYCYVDGNLYCSASWQNEWEMKAIALDNDALHVIKWEFRSGGYGSSCWIDDVKWNANGGWLDPEDTVVEMSMTTSCALDLTGPDWTLTAPPEEQLIVFNPEWARAAKVRVTVNDAVIAEMSEAGVVKWLPQTLGEYEVSLVQLNSADELIGQLQTVIFKVERVTKKGTVVFIK